MTLLEASHVHRILTGEIAVTLVKDINLCVETGEFITITGPSGSGKSSLLYLLGLLDIPTQGHIFFQGKDMGLLSQEEQGQVRLNHMGFVFQFHFLLPEFTALENVILPMARLGRLSSQDRQERAEALLVQLGLKDCLHKVPKQLSGGQSQRVSIARSLGNNPAIIFADEPTGNLDQASSELVQEILMGLSHERGCAVLCVTHDQTFAKKAKKRIHLIDGAMASIRSETS
ncbi:MAG: ABC transporter ATP-binding protein [Alphaproteobacteria bacterium]|jgi:lipoprotein-releasing system ATP-binding protein